MALERSRVTETSCMREGCLTPWQFMCVEKQAPGIIEVCGFRSCDDNLHYCDHSAGKEGEFMRFIDIAAIL